ASPRTISPALSPLPKPITETLRSVSGMTRYCMPLELDHPGRDEPAVAGELAADLVHAAREVDGGDPAARQRRLVGHVVPPHGHPLVENARNGLARARARCIRHEPGPLKPSSRGAKPTPSVASASEVRDATTFGDPAPQPVAPGSLRFARDDG